MTDEIFTASNGTVLEQWKPIPGYETLYEVSSHGTVRSLDRVTEQGHKRSGRTLKTSPSKDGHPTLRLFKNGKGKNYYVHRLVLMAFVGMPREGQVGRHLNDIPHDNRIENLAWGTISENALDAVRNGRNPRALRRHCPRGHSLTAPNLVKNKPSGRECLACSRVQIPVDHPSFKSLSDKKYREIITGEWELKQNLCKRGHALEHWNLIAHSAAEGRRQCLSCHRARSRAKSARIPFTQDLADKYFSSIMHEYKTGNAVEVFPSLKKRDPETGQFCGALSHAERIYPREENQ